MAIDTTYFELNEIAQKTVEIHENNIINVKDGFKNAQNQYNASHQSVVSNISQQHSSTINNLESQKKKVL